jgi:hypothetical protein
MSAHQFANGKSDLQRINDAKMIVKREDIATGQAYLNKLRSLFNLRGPSSSSELMAPLIDLYGRLPKSGLAIGGVKDRDLALVLSRSQGGETYFEAEGRHGEPAGRRWSIGLVSKTFVRSR